MRLSVLLVLACARLAGAQPPPSEPEDEPGSNLTVYVMTMEPGDLIWEKFGHNALWVHDTDRNTHTIYNWGWFDFDQEWFFIRFLHGKMLYSLQADEVGDLRDLYRRYNPRLPDYPPPIWLVLQYIVDDRTVHIQELNLTPAQRATLQEFLDWNVLPENKDYSYDYYIDNCSTRVRDAIDLAVDGQLSAQTQDLPTDHSYRWHTRRLTGNSIGWYTTLHALLGQPVERPITAWEEMFLPMELMQRLRTITIRDEHGNEVPLVRSESPLYETTTRGPYPQATPNHLPWFLVSGLLLGGLIAALARYARRTRFARIALTAVGIPWYLYTGILGLVLVYGWIFTDHWAGYRNENLLHFSPLGLAMLALIPLMAFGRPTHARRAFRLLIVILAGSLLGIALKLLPWFHQSNAEIILLSLPVHTGMLLATWQLLLAPAQETAPPPSSKSPFTRPRKRGQRAKA